MSTSTRRPAWRSWLVTLILGALMSAAIWLAGAREVAFLGFLLAGIATEPGRGRACRPGRLRRPAP